MKYISADFIKAIIKGDRLMQGNCEYELWKQEVDKKVDDMPSIDIVRCKECGKRMTGDCPMCNGCKLERIPTEDDAFCSYG